MCCACFYLSRMGKMIQIRNVPDPLHRPSGCSFHPRCWLASPECTVTNVQLEVIGANRQTACLHHERLAEAASRG